MPEFIPSPEILSVRREKDPVDEGQERVKAAADAL